MEEKQREERGPKTPGVNLATAIEFLRRVREGVGMGRASRDTVAQALGYTAMSGTARRALAALTHFGLMERSGAAAMQVSELGRHILMPRDNREAQRAIAEAAMNPALYQKLFDRFGGHALPNLLPNILVRDFAVFPTSSDEVATIFRDSVEFAGLLQNGVLVRALPNEGSAGALNADSGRTDANTGTTENVSTESTESRTFVTPAVPPGSQRYTIPLDSNGKLAAIDIPLPVLPTDLRRIRKWAEYMLSLADDDEE